MCNIAASGDAPCQGSWPGEMQTTPSDSETSVVAISFMLISEPQPNRVMTSNPTVSKRVMRSSVSVTSPRAISRATGLADDGDDSRGSQSSRPWAANLLEPG